MIRPRKESLIGAKHYPGSQKRDDAGQIIQDLRNDQQAVDLWKTRTRYGRRSLVETFFSRLKGRLGSRV